MATATKKAPVSETEPADFASWPYSFENVPLAAVIVDEGYQRDMSEKWVADRSTPETFRPHLFGVITLSERKGTGGRRLACFDGQHRTKMARNMQFETVPALVYQGLTRAQEAQLFADLQGERRGMHSVDKFRAQLVGGDPVAKDIERLALAGGFSISKKGGPYVITAPAAVTSIYNLSPELLEATLWVIAEAWRGDMPTGSVVRAVGRFMDDWGLENVDQARLAQRLGTLGINQLVARAMATKDSRGGKGSISEVDYFAVIEATYQRTGKRAA